MKIQKKKVNPQGKNIEFPISRKEEALNSRNLGGETVPSFKDESPIIPVKKGPRNTEGVASKYPLQVSRPGERRL